MTDMKGRLFILRCGGALRAEEGDLDETIFSVSQMLAACVASDGKQGGFMGGKSLAITFPGDHVVSVAVQDGLFGVRGRFLTKDDPLWKTLDVVWGSADQLHYPAKGLWGASARSELCLLLDRPKFKVHALGTTDNGDVAAATKAVKTDLIDAGNVDLMLKQFTHVGPMELNTDEKKRIWLGKWGGSFCSSF